MTKKLTLIIMGLLIGIGFTVFAAPSYNIFRTLNPETDIAYDVGSSTLRWRNIYAQTYYGDGSQLTGVLGGGVSGIINEPTSTPTSEISLNAGFNYMYDPTAGNWSFIRGATSKGLFVSNNSFPASSTLSDAMSNPTTVSLGAYNLFWDGTQWVRSKSDSSGYLSVNSSSSQAGSWNVGQTGQWNTSSSQAGTWTVAATQSGTWTISSITGAVTVATTTNKISANVYPFDHNWLRNVTTTIASGDTAVLVAPGSGLRNCVHLIEIINTGMSDFLDVHFEQNGNSTSVQGLEPKYIPAYGGAGFWDNRGKCIQQGEANLGLDVNINGGTSSTITVWYEKK